MTATTEMQAMTEAAEKFGVRLEGAIREAVHDRVLGNDAISLQLLLAWYTFHRASGFRMGEPGMSAHELIDQIVSIFNSAERSHYQ